jgi:pumilio family protein 6
MHCIARVQEMLKSVDDIADDQFGRKVIYYLLAPRDPHHFHPDIINIVTEGDGNPSRFERTTFLRYNFKPAAMAYMSIVF